MNHHQEINQEQRLPRRWLVLVVVLALMISSLGCSLADKLVGPVVRADGPKRLALATRTPWPTYTPTNQPYPTPTPTFTPWPTLVPSATAMPTSIPLPTNTPLPAATATLMLIPTATPWPTPANTPVPVPPTATPPPSPTPTPSFAYQVAQIYQEGTTNHFLTGYVAVVNVQEIPIGGVKAVGSFEPGGQRHESPLSQWFFDVSTAPGATAKTGSVKFEPPGGIQAGTWSLHLEDEWGARLSEDVAISTDPENPEWFFIKFRQPGLPVAVASAPPTPSAGAVGVTAAIPVASGNTGSCLASMAVPGWSFVNTRCSYSPDLRGVTLYGELINNNRSSQHVFYLIADLLDDRGEWVDGIHDTPMNWPIDSVPSGGQVPVVLTSQDAPGVVDFELKVMAQATGQTPRQDFELSDVDASGDGRDYCVTGRLSNAGGQLGDYLVVVAVLYDDHGNVINFDSYQDSSPDNILGDQPLDFEVCVDPLNQAVTDYEVRAWGQ